MNAQLREAATALWAMDEGDRQLSASQRYNLRAARSNLFVLGVVLVLVLVPLFGFAGSCSVLALSVDGGIQPMTLVMILGGSLPFLLGMGASILALRHVRNRGKALAERCAALPPANQGEPARCHVCGGFLEVAQKQGVVRCGFCRADNLVSDDVLGRMTARRELEVGQIREQVVSHARALDRSALTAGALAFVTMVLSPIVSIVFVFIAVIVGSAIELEPRTDATYTLVDVTNAQCVAEVSGQLDFGDTGVGFETRPLPQSGHVPKKSRDFVGMEVGREDGQRGRVKRIFRDAISPSIDRVELDIGGRSENAKLTSLCEVPAKRRRVAGDPRLRGATRVELSGDDLWVAKLSELYRVPKAGGAIAETLVGRAAIADFLPSPKGVFVIVSTPPGTPSFIERWQGSEREQVAEGNVLALDGEDLVFGNAKGVYRRQSDGKLTEVSPSLNVAQLQVTERAIYWYAGAQFFELDKKTGTVRDVERVFEVSSFAVVGRYIAMVGVRSGATRLSLDGGVVEALGTSSFTKGRVRSSDGIAYLGLESSTSRGGVAGLRPGSHATSNRHYGIDSGRAEAFTVGAGEVFWVADETLHAEPVVP